MYYLIILVLLFVAELFYFRVADRCNIIDKPNERSSHTKVTLRGGGIIFYFGALAYFLTSGFEYPYIINAAIYKKCKDGELERDPDGLGAS